MLQVEKILNAGNYELVIKWSDGTTQLIKAKELQKHCPCICCAQNPQMPDINVKILAYELKGRIGLKIQFSSGCQKGIYSFNQLRSWLKN